MKVLVASSVCWTIEMSCWTSPDCGLGILADQALDDLCLEDDVGEALGRAVMHRPGDLAAQVLLGTHQESGHRRRHRLVAGAVGPTHGLIACGAPALEVVGDGVAVARERPPLAVEDLDLGLHQGSAPGERDERSRLLQAVGLTSWALGSPATLSAAVERRAS